MSGDTPIEQQMAAELRALADWIEKRPLIAKSMMYRFHDIHAFPTKDDWPAALKEAGSFEKDSTDGGPGWLYARVGFGHHVSVKLAIEKEHTCERVQVGAREVEREVYPDDVVPAIVREVEPVYEWKCPESWIGGAS